MASKPARVAASRFAPADLIAAVQASPAAVAAHDRNTWIGLFADDGEVNDPVGSTPHLGHTAIGHFYDTFIAPNTIVFHVDRDIVCGMTVVRDLTIETTMSTGITLPVPMHLRYELVDQGGKLKVQRLYAHWELAPMVLQMLGKGGKGLWTSIKLGGQMMRNLGLGGALGFSRGFAGVGDAGKRRLESFLGALGAGNLAAAEQQLAEGATLECPFGTALPLKDFAARLRDLRWSKLLAAGYTITASVSVAGDSVRGVALFGFDRSSRKINHVQVFVPA